MSEWWMEEMSNARLHLRDQGILVQTAVVFGNPGDRVAGTYLGLMATEHGVVAVVRVKGDLLLPTHYSNLTKV